MSTYVCDVSRLDSIRETASSVKRDVGDVEVLVNNAGILHGGALLKLSEADIRRTMDINIMAYIWVMTGLNIFVAYILHAGNWATSYINIIYALSPGKYKTMS